VEDRISRKDGVFILRSDHLSRLISNDKKEMRIHGPN
jgi:hypothetical protein